MEVIEELEQLAPVLAVYGNMERARWYYSDDYWATKNMKYYEEIIA